MTQANAFRDLIAVIDRLLADDGCPWDREQTTFTLSPMLLEEVCETIDSVRDEDAEHLADELGDLFVGAIFFAKAAQKEGRFDWEEPFKKGREKLIRRHPHIFKDATNLTSEQVKEQWEELKKKEPTHVRRKSHFEGVPASLPGLAMMQKLLVKTKKHPEVLRHLETCVKHAQHQKNSEEVLGAQLAELVLKAEAQGIQAEQALRRFYSTCRQTLEQEKI